EERGFADVRQADDAAGETQDDPVTHGGAKSEGRMLLPAGDGKVNRRPDGALFPGKRHGSTRFKVFNDRRRHSDAAPVIARNKMSRPAPVVSVAALLIAAVVALVPVQDAGALTVTE